MSKSKPRIRIKRPPDAAPNTAFTQLSQPSERGYRKLRVAIDPSDLADDSFDEESAYEVCGRLVWVSIRPNGETYCPQDGFFSSCRSVGWHTSRFSREEDQYGTLEYCLGYADRK
jgi:hypothetical protein